MGGGKWTFGFGSVKPAQLAVIRVVLGESAVATMANLSTEKE